MVTVMADCAVSGMHVTSAISLNLTTYEVAWYIIISVVSVCQTVRR